MVAGHLCLDIIPRFKEGSGTRIEDVLQPGKLVNVDEASISTGGPVSNTGINMKTLGNSVCFSASVGDDQFGRLTIEALTNKGNAEGIHIRKGNASSYTIVIAPPGIDRVFLHNPGTNDSFCAGDLEPALISSCRHFHFGYPPLMESMYSNEGESLLEVFRIAKEAGATTSCDMSLPDPVSASGRAPWRLILEKILPYVDLFLPSIEETFYMLYPEEFLKLKQAHGGDELINHLAPSEYSRLASEILEMGTRIVTLKSGHRGIYIKSARAEYFRSLGAAKPGDTYNWGGRELWVPAFKPDQFGSATGSGDSAIAGFLSGFLRGMSIEESLKASVCCGLQNIRVLDAVSGIQSWEVTQAMLKENLPLIDPRIESEGWRWWNQFGLWTGPEDKLFNHKTGS
jgi:sugar/nucleoside kinase (ribokinase family)